MMESVFEVVDHGWRGIGVIPQERPAAEGALRPLRRGSAPSTSPRRPRPQAESVCIAGLVLQGIRKPVDCPAFGSDCTPEHCLGAPMVSSEGACAAYYHYARQGARPVTVFPECPLPLDEYPRVLLAHGGGGRLTQSLIERVLLPSFDNPYLAPLHDGALLDIGGQRLALSTDSYVVQPLFFPGGDIGRLAVFGTANDLAMCGARPLFLSCGLIIEEGLRDGGPVARRRLDEGSGAGGRRPDRHRRQQGGRARQGRRRLHQHRRHRRCARRASTWARSASSRATRLSSAARSGATASL